ncbi:MAG: hypothetical protein WC526_00040 [Patescibacteria group bacterium]
MTHTTHQAYTLAVAYRGHGLGIAVTLDGELLDVLRHRIPARRPVRSTIRFLVRKATTSYPPRIVIVETNTRVHTIARQLDRCRVRSVSLDEIKSVLMAGRRRSTRHDVFQHLIDLHPKLRRLVTLIPGTRRLAINEARRTVPLLAVALVLAAQRLQTHRRRRPHGRPATI